MIAVLEPVFTDMHHGPGNAGLLEAIMLAFPNEQITFVAASTHRVAIKETLGAVDATLGQFDIDILPPGGKSIARIRAQLRAMRQALQALRPRILVCLSSTPETFFACRLLSLQAHSLRIVVVLHGNLHDAIGWRSLDPRHRLLDSRSSLFVGRCSPIRFVVIESAIRVEALARGLLPPNRTDVWPHTILVDEVRPLSRRLLSNKISIAYLGAAKRSKGFDQFLTVMRRVQQSNPNGYNFSVIGAMCDQFTAEETLGLELAKAILPRDKYLERLRQVDYVYLPLQPETYSLTASGSLIDSVASAIPLIATRTGAVAHMAANGPIGFLADRPEALADLVLEHARLADRATYEVFRRNLVNLQKQRFPAVIARAVRETLGKERRRSLLKWCTNCGETPT